MSPTLAYFLGIVTAAALPFVVRALKQTAEPFDFDDSEAPAPVDPWALQREVMTISDQFVPQRAALTKTAVLYAALIMEEVGETLIALQRAFTENATHLQTRAPGHYAVGSTLGRMGAEMEIVSVTLRNRMAEWPDFNMPLSPESAQELLDGTTDITVVNSGFAIAAGLPGAAGYEEIVQSNLSKANPDTGKIDKTPDGKWIKGRCYFRPNLGRVLTEQHAC